MEIRVFIADDEQRAVEALKSVLETFFTNVVLVGSANSVDEACEKILETKPHLLFLDIEMGSESGFQLLQKFDRVDFQVAFVTAHEEFALKAIKFSAIDYIIKPASVGDLKTLLSKMEEKLESRTEDQRVKNMFGNFNAADKSEHKISIPTAQGFEFVKVDNIYYLKADGSYTDIHLKAGGKLTTSRNLKFFEGILEGYGFFRIHNSNIINLKYVKRFHKSGGGSIIMEDDEELSISKSRKDEVMELLALN